MKIKDAKRVHIIGIGGIGISALARMLHHRGVGVSGVNDAESHETLDGLRSDGVQIDILDGEYSVPEADVYVYSVAWEERAPEVLRDAQATGKRVLTYFEALGEIAKEYKVIAISGTHGKTTTTAMTARAMIAAGLDPTVIVGSMVNFENIKGSDPSIPTNFRAGQSEYLLVEACEYKRHFLNFNPYILAVTNIELDHTDYYKDLADIEDAFAELASQSEIVLAEESINNQMLSVPELAVPGEHNKQNAALSLAILDALGADKSLAKKGLAEFTGTWRRFDYKGKTKNGALVYDDYAHHPTAIKAAIQGAKEAHPQSRVIVAFEPHTYSRTQSLMSEFAKCFAEADEVVIAPIYAAREEAIAGVTAGAMVKAIQANGQSAQEAESLEQAAKLAESLAQDGDVVILMGAGELFMEVDKIVI
jgi:UDP-N-acetylmuramate--alanine ligase